jgi:hypothetical protein
MDPYLEHPAVWPGLHIRLIAASSELLQPELRRRGYYVDIGERVFLTEPQRNVYPDLAVHRPASRRETVSGELAVLEADEPVHIKRVQVEVREPFLEIFDAAGNRLVTGIEFVSPTNKSDMKGRELYEQKRRERIAADVNLVEIDLLRAGRPLVDVSPAVLDGLKPWDYLVNILRPGDEEYEVYPIRLRSRLPRIRIPLKAGEAGAGLDLQAALDRAYDAGPYPERVDYSAEAFTPLAPADTAWADQILKQQGLRSGGGVPAEE